MEYSVAADGCERLVSQSWSMVADERQPGESDDHPSCDGYRRTDDDKPASAWSSRFLRFACERGDLSCNPQEIRVIAKRIDHLSR